MVRLEGRLVNYQPFLLTENRLINADLTVATYSVFH